MDYDLIIRGGTVVDGTRLPRYRSDVGIRGGRIVKLGRIAQTATAGRVLDAEGCIVAPGFVDLHTHYDAQIHWDPYCTISGWHGVTSVVLGNCGFGFAPVKPAERDRALLMMTRTEQIPYESMKEGMPFTWETLPEWLDALQRLPKGVNVVSYVPVSPLMVYVMGLEAAKSRPATPAERKEMQRLLNEAMDAGACGFSLQRLGEHSLQADVDGTPMPTDTMADEDVLCLAEVLRDRDEGFIQITQAQGGDPMYTEEGERKNRDRAFVELLARTAQRPVLYNVIAAVDGKPWLHEKSLEWIHRCNEQGLRIYAQGFNVRAWFNFSMADWNLYDCSPAWNEATQGSIEDKLAKLADPVRREAMKKQHRMLRAIGDTVMPEALTVTRVPDDTPGLQKYLGRLIADIAEEEGKHVTDAMLDIAVAGKLRVLFRSGLATSGDAELVGPLMSDPYVIAGVSDGGAHTKFFAGGSYTTDYLTWLVRDEKKISLEEAHYHLSYLPAQAAGFADRGFLREGAPADVVVYDMGELKRTPEWEFEVLHDLPANEWRVVQKAEGYRWTIVNGEITFENGDCTGATPGKLLRNNQVSSQTFATAAE